MKFNPILFCIFLLLAVALAWAGYEMCCADKQAVAMAAVVGIGLTVAGACFATNMGHASGNVNGKAAVTVYVVLNVVINVVFSFFEFSIPAFVITNLVLLALLLLILYMVSKAGDV